MEQLVVKGLNLNIVWKNPEENFRKITKAWEGQSADILLLPEMFSTGFCMDASEIADRRGAALTFMQELAGRSGTAVCGSIAVAEHGEYFNRMFFVKPDLTYAQYDKRHLFSHSGEDAVYRQGSERTVVEYRGWRILLQVCYDLRFPVFSRNVNDYDAAFYVANWPEPRADAWKTLMKARAIENQAYVFGLNRIGTDGNNLHYPESSHCFFPDGTDISVKTNDWVEAVLDAEKLTTFRQKFSFLKDQDLFRLL